MLETIQHVGKQFLPLGFSRSALLTSWGGVDVKHLGTGSSMMDVSFNRETYQYEQTTIGVSLRYPSIEARR